MYKLQFGYQDNEFIVFYEHEIAELGAALSKKPNYHIYCNGEIVQVLWNGDQYRGNELLFIESFFPVFDGSFKIFNDKLYINDGPFIYNSLCLNGGAFVSGMGKIYMSCIHSKCKAGICLIWVNTKFHAVHKKHSADKFHDHCSDDLPPLPTSARLTKISIAELSMQIVNSDYMSTLILNEAKKQKIILAACYDENLKSYNSVKKISEDEIEFENTMYRKVSSYLDLVEYRCTGKFKYIPPKGIYSVYKPCPGMIIVKEVGDAFKILAPPFAMHKCYLKTKPNPSPVEALSPPNQNPYDTQPSTSASVSLEVQVVSGGVQPVRNVAVDQEQNVQVKIYFVDNYDRWIKCFFTKLDECIIT